MGYITKIVKCFEKSRLLIKGASEASVNKGKEQKGGFFDNLLGTRDASVLGNCQQVQELFGLVKGKRRGFLVLPHPFINLEYKNIIKIKTDLMVLIQEIIYLR